MSYTLDDIAKIIEKSKPQLLDTLDLGVRITAELKKRKVITPDLDDSLKVEVFSPAKKIDLFLDDVKRGPVSRFLNFCKIMEENDRTQILEIMEVDMDVINSQLGTSTKPETTNGNSASAAVVVSGSQSQVPLWDSKHPKALILFEDDEDLMGKMLDKTPKLKQTVKLDDVWAHLKRYRVMNPPDVKRCKGAPGAEDDQVERIVEFLERGPVWKVHGFFKSLFDTDQKHAIDAVFGEDAWKKYQ